MAKRKKSTNTKNNQRKLSLKERVRAIAQVAVVSYKAAPAAVIVQVVGSIINAVLPITMTYFAALTTTELVSAIAGKPGAERLVIIYVIITAALGVVQAGWSSLQQYITRLMSYRVEAAVSDQMYEHFLKLDFWRYDDKVTIDTFDKASQFARFFPYVFSRLADIVSQLINMIAGIIAMTLVSWWLGLILLVAVIPGLFIQFRLSRQQMLHWNENVETRRRKAMIEWNILQPQYMAELRIYGMVRFLLDTRQRLRDLDEKDQIEYERKYIGLRFVADAIESTAEIVALVWTVIRIINRELPIGNFIYVQQIVSRTLSGATALVSTISQIDEDLANLFDYQAFMEAPEAVGGTRVLHDIPDKIELDNVTFHYPQSETPVLKDISLTIEKGQHVAIVGENGAGKSTLIKVLTGLYQPSSGSVLLDGTPLGEFSVASWHKQMGILQQQYLAYGFATARENVYFGDVSEPYDEARFSRAVDLAEARTFLEKLPKGFDNYVINWMEDGDGNKGVDISGGQWQRLALARDFYRNSPLIILDEPTSAIDALAEARIFEHLFAETHKTIVVISHRMTTVKKADVIFMLKDGEIVERGTHDELVEKHGEYYRMFKSQL